MEQYQGKARGNRYARGAIKHLVGNAEGASPVKHIIIEGGLEVRRNSTGNPGSYGHYGHPVTRVAGKHPPPYRRAAFISGYPKNHRVLGMDYHIHAFSGIVLDQE